MVVGFAEVFVTCRVVCSQREAIFTELFFWIGLGIVKRRNIMETDMFFLR
jgi:hypothetical protein